MRVESSWQMVITIILVSIINQFRVARSYMQKGTYLSVLSPLFLSSDETVKDLLERILEYQLE